jgi:hypothetical protein
VAAAVLVLAALAGCTGADDGADADAPAAGATADDRTAATEAADAGDDPPRTTATPIEVASLAGLVPGRTVVDSQGLRITVTPVTLRRAGDLVELELTARNEDEDTVANLVDSLGTAGSLFLESVSLIDPEGAKRYLVVYDDAGQCLCTTFAGGLTVQPGGTGFVRAVLTAPPPEVESVTVDLPRVGAFPDVPVS